MLLYFSLLKCKFDIVNLISCKSCQYNNDLLFIIKKIKINMTHVSLII